MFVFISYLLDLGEGGGGKEPLICLMDNCPVALDGITMNCTRVHQNNGFDVLKSNFTTQMHNIKQVALL